jgi:ribonucleotide monophosphatase NagD (HAD superfamily)
LQGVLLDQYGCLHDGRQPYPGAIQAVAALAEAGMHIVLLSNSSRSADAQQNPLKCA